MEKNWRIKLEILSMRSKQRRGWRTCGFGSENKVEKTRKETKLRGRTNLAWISETCDLVSGHLWTDHCSLENRKGRERKGKGGWKVQAGIGSDSSLLLYQSEDRKNKQIRRRRRRSREGTVIGEELGVSVPIFSTGVFSGRKPCWRSWLIISPSSVSISDIMLHGTSPLRPHTSAL